MSRKDKGSRSRELACDFCGASITRTQSKINKKNYCNNSCRASDRLGASNPNWNGGVSGDRYSLEYKQWRLDVLKQGDFTCTCCGERGGKLEVHHILAFSRYPEARLSLDNGSILCKSCHKEFHDTYGRLEFTDDDYFTWIYKEIV